MQELQQIVFEITTEKDQPKSVSFDPKILDFHIDYLSNNHNEPYPIPSNIASSLRPFEVMRVFLEAHQYTPTSFKIVKPIRSSNYADIVDPLTFKIFAKYTDDKLFEEVAEVIALSRFIGFHQLTDAIGAAVAVNYYIAEDDKSLEEFIKANGLEDMSSEQICEVMKLYEDQFRLIQYKAKEEIMKMAENELASQM